MISSLPSSSSISISSLSLPSLIRTILIFFFIIIPLLLLQGVNGEIRKYSGVLDPSPYFIHYSEGYIIVPGSVDFSSLAFIPSSEVGFYEDDDVDDDDFLATDDGTGIDDDDDDDDGGVSGGGGGGNGGGDGDGERFLLKLASASTSTSTTFTSTSRMIAASNVSDATTTTTKTASSSSFTDKTFIDIVLFRQPDDCAKSKEGCDWTELGIGSKDSEGNLRWCCWDDAISLGMCNGDSSDVGRLLINTKLYNGQRRTLEITDLDVNKEMYLSNPLINVNEDDEDAEDGSSGVYILILSNCNGLGHVVNVSGEYIWESKHGYLPGERFGEMMFYTLVLGLYLGMMIWYGGSMWYFKHYIITIQKWILGTIFMGLMECLFKTGDLWVWNLDGVRFWFAMYVGVVLGILKQAISRCLVIMVCLGWGVIRDSLNDELPKILILGIFYIALSLTRDILEILAVVDMDTVGAGGDDDDAKNVNKEVEMLDMAIVLAVLVYVVNVIIYIWIFIALNNTMDYLSQRNQNVKLGRYLRLRLVLLLSVLFGIAWSIFGIVDKLMENDSLVELNSTWVLYGAWEMNYILVLFGIAILWRPNDAAKQFAFVMELPSVGGDGEEDDDEVGNVAFETNEGLQQDDDDDEKDEMEPINRDGTNKKDNNNNVFTIDESCENDENDDEQLNGGGEETALKIDSAIHT